MTSKETVLGTTIAGFVAVILSLYLNDLPERIVGISIGIVLSFIIFSALENHFR